MAVTSEYGISPIAAAKSVRQIGEHWAGIDLVGCRGLVDGRGITLRIEQAGGLSTAMAPLRWRGRASVRPTSSNARCRVRIACDGPRATRAPARHQQRVDAAGLIELLLEPLSGTKTARTSPCCGRSENSPEVRRG